MPDTWAAMSASSSATPESFGFQLAKGGAWLINFHLACCSHESLIVPPGLDGEIAETMFVDVLGNYPQPPFLLHHVAPSQAREAYESIRLLMSAVDDVAYPKWEASELENLLPLSGGAGASAA